MRIALISMPWAIFNRPSIQLGALQSYLRGQEPAIEVVTCHPYLDVAGKIGFEAYRIISGDSWAGEALYCALLFPEIREQAAGVFSRSLGKRTAAALPGFDSLCDQLDDLLDQWLRDHDFSDIRLAGFSVCFGQLPGTLLAARRLKKKYPGISIVLGGSTCIPEVGSSLLRVFPDIDHIITGEGERPLLSLCRRLMGRPEPGAAPFLSRRPALPGQDEQQPVLSADYEVHDLNSLPVPDYDDYFAELKQAGLGFIPELPVEFSRGCWWNKCAFCNLNLQWCGYRFKDSTRMLREVELLAGKYRCLDFAFTDNALPPAEADRFFAAMPASGKDIRFFAEIRTTSKPEQYGRFRSGGLDSVQIGIEAFANSLLKRMSKGVTVMDNLAAMKHCAEAGIRLDGNLILDFPGSTEQEVLETLRVLEFVLPYRPLTAAAFFLGHGSPVWSNPGDYGIRTIRHHPYNRQLYPGSVLSGLELLIKQGTGDRGRQRRIWRPVRKKIQEWAAFHQKRAGSVPALSYRNGGEFIIIRQELPGMPAQHHRLTGMSGKIYVACRNPVAIKSLLRDFNSVTEKALTVFLEDLENKKLLFRDGDMYLALALEQSPAGP